MATCKDCLHADVCQNHCDEQYCEGCSSCMFRSCNFSDRAEKCPNFNDRSRFFELPCKVGTHLFRVTKPYRGEPKVTEFVVKNFRTFGKRHQMQLEVQAINVPGTNWMRYQDFYLTREEAEADLARRTANG